MLEDYRGLAIFHAVAEAGSFSAAARQLKLSTSVVSHHVSKLEAKLGASLFFRSTRALSLTPEGQAILDAARRMVAAGQDAIDMLADQSDQPVGSLRITLPSFGGQGPVHRAIWDFAELYPMVTMSILSSDRPLDLVKEGLDLAIRLGQLSDSTLKSRRIGTFQRVIVATPDYLAGRPPIETLDDLRQCGFITYSMLPDRLTLVRGGESVTLVKENSRLEVSSIATATSAGLAGLGVVHLPLSEAEAPLARGAFVEVLPDWRLPDLGVYAVWSDTGPQKKLARRLIDHLAARAV